MPLPPTVLRATNFISQRAAVVYDLTFRFVQNYLAHGERTVDQMIQFARSEKKNILEGSKAARASA